MIKNKKRKNKPLRGINQNVIMMKKLLLKLNWTYHDIGFNLSGRSYPVDIIDTTKKCIKPMIIGHCDTVVMREAILASINKHDIPTIVGGGFYNEKDNSLDLNTEVIRNHMLNSNSQVIPDLITKKQKDS